MAKVEINLFVIKCIGGIPAFAGKTFLNNFIFVMYRVIFCIVVG